MKHEIKLFGCGYNGFNQFSGLLAFGKKTVENPKGDRKICLTNPMEDTTSVLSPQLLVQCSASLSFRNVTFTWSRIASVFFKNGKTKDVTVISGFSKLSSPSETKNSDYYWITEDEEAVGSTDCDIVLRDRLQDDATQGFKILHEGETQSKNMSFESKSSTNTDMKIFCGHSELYFTNGSNCFGKLEATKRLPEQGGEDLPIEMCLRCIDLSVKIQTISCGKEHALLLSQFGSVYSYGLGSRGQLGHGDVEMQISARLIESLEGVKMTGICAGGWHSTAISDICDVYSWGWNESGQLGLASAPSEQNDTKSSVHSSNSSEVEGIVTEPKCVTLPDDVDASKAVCGSRHTLVLSKCGRVFSCGWNAYGQLGLGDVINRIHFQEIPAPGELKWENIFAGHWCSFLVSESEM